MTFVVVGAGPTGVEMAGQILELSRRTLRHDFRRIDTTKARAATRPGVHRNETRSRTVTHSHLALFRTHFTAATVVSNTPVRILPSDFVCTQMRYGPDFGNA